jgi:hypothetical protein
MSKSDKYFTFIILLYISTHHKLNIRLILIYYKLLFVFVIIYIFDNIANKIFIGALVILVKVNH